MNIFDFNPDDTYRLILGLTVLMFLLFCIVAWAERGNHHR